MNAPTKHAYTILPEHVESIRRYMDDPPAEGCTPEEVAHALAEIVRKDGRVAEVDGATVTFERKGPVSFRSYTLYVRAP